MIIDFHTHIFPDELAPRALAKICDGMNWIYKPVTNMTAMGLLANMDESGIGISVVQPVLTKPSQTVKTNEWARSLHSGRLVAFGGLHPDSGDFRRDIDFIVSLGLKGIKLHPEYQDFILDDLKMLRIYDYALSRGLILLIHAGFDPLYPPPYKSDPRRFANVLDAMRGGVIIAAHLGGHAQWDDVLRYLAGRDIYFDTAMGFKYFPRDIFLKIVETHGADKLLFGTDSPWSEAKSEIAILNDMPLSEHEKTLIFGGNAKRLLGSR